MTADEAQWMIRSSQFWHELFRQGNPGGTFMTTHPGATAMWIMGAGEFIQEARLGVQVDTSTLQYFRWASTVPLAIVASMLIACIAWLAGRLMGIIPGIATGVLLALDPYLTGMNQVAHLDGLLALLLVAAVVLFLLALQRSRSSYMVWAGIFFGLAAATKFLPSLFFLPWVGGVALLYGQSMSWQQRCVRAVRMIGLVVAAGGVVLFLLWPALWVKADISNSFVKDIPIVVETSHVEMYEEAGELVNPGGFYIRTLLGRTTSFVLLSVFAVVVVVARSLGSKQTRGYLRSQPIVWVIAFSVGFLVFITLVAKKADRYALPALAALPLVAVFGVDIVVRAIQQRVSGARMYVASSVLIILLIGQLLLLAPYAIAYSAPLFGDMRPFSQQGWGEGLDAAARILSDHPLAAQMTVASWYPSVFGTYFKGKTLSLSSISDDRVGFVVLYRNMLGRGPSDQATNVWDQFRDVTPYHVVEIQGEPYVWIFETLGVKYFPQHVSELLPGASVGQMVPVSFTAWDSIDIGISTFSGRAQDADIVLHVRESLEATNDIRTVRLLARDIADSDWNTFSFEPINDSQGKIYYVFLTTTTGKEGDALTVRYVNKDVKPGEMVWFDATSRSTADIAYRLENR